MLKTLQKGLFPTIIGITALSVSASAAFYSVSGLSKLFAGASFEVTIMAASLEVAKLIVVSLLHNYWKDLNKLLRVYLMVASTILILITSMGIYGFLSSAYQETYSKLNSIENQKAFIQQKVDFYQKDVTRYDEELERISNNISTLSNAKASTIEVRDTSVAGGVRRTISTSELRAAQARIKVEEQNRKETQSKREIVADSLQKYQLEILELDNNNEVAGELGPLQYISGLTGTPMDKIINWLLLVIIFVFDPLAIALVIAANFAFEKAFPKKRYKENLYGEQVEEPTKTPNKTDSLQDETPNWGWGDVPLEDPEPSDNPLEQEVEYEVVTPQINEGENWELESEINDDFEDQTNNIIITPASESSTNEEVETINKHIEKLEERINQGLSPWRTAKIKNEINSYKESLPDNSDTITYS